jgi:hypothetical protein
VGTFLCTARLLRRAVPRRAGASWQRPSQCSEKPQICHSARGLSARDLLFFWVLTSRSAIPSSKSLRANAPACFSSSANIRAKFSKSSAGTALVPQPLPPPIPTASPYPDYSTTSGSSLRPTLSESLPGNHTLARPPQIPGKRSPPPYPFPRPAIHTPAACSSTRYHVPLGANTTESPTAPSQFSSRTIPTARGNRTATKSTHPRSNTANAPVPAAPRGHESSRAPAQPPLLAVRHPRIRRFGIVRIASAARLVRQAAPLPASRRNSRFVKFSWPSKHSVYQGRELPPAPHSSTFVQSRKRISLQ